MLRGADCGTAPASQSRLRHEGRKNLVRRLLVRTAVAAVFISFAVAGFPAADVVQSSEARRKARSRLRRRHDQALRAGHVAVAAADGRRADADSQALPAHPRSRVPRLRRAPVAASGDRRESRRTTLPTSGSGAAFNDTRGPGATPADPYWGGLQMDRGFMLTLRAPTSAAPRVGPPVDADRADVGRRAGLPRRPRLLPMAEHRADVRSHLVADRLENNPLSASAVELGVEDLLPRAEVELPVGDRKHDLVAHQVPLEVRIGIVLTVVVAVLLESARAARGARASRRSPGSTLTRRR